MRVKRLTGGPFNIRPAEWSRKELNSALAEIVGKYETKVVAIHFLNHNI